MSATSGDFAGTPRYAVQKRIGAGGMGVVYLAFDKERGVDVALKTLKRFDPQGLLRFKREFRALADVTHPNLAALHDLRIESLHVRARGALARSYVVSDKEKFIRYAEGDAKKLAKENVPWASAIAHLIRAGADCARGMHEEAASKFEAAETQLKSLDMALLANGARHRRGELIGGATGAQLKAEAATWMRERGIKKPEAWVNFLVAGPR